MGNSHSVGIGLGAALRAVEAAGALIDFGSLCAEEEGENMRMVHTGHLHTALSFE